MFNNSKVLVVLLLITAFIAGRYSSPRKIEESEHQSQTSVEKEMTEIEKDKHKETTVTETERPDGTKSKTTVIVEDSKTDTSTKKDDTSSSSKSHSKELDDIPIVNVSLLLGSKVNLFSIDPPIYGIYASKTLLGPITVGAFGMSDRTVGLSLGLSF